jgi:hypothetical protein
MDATQGNAEAASEAPSPATAYRGPDRRKRPTPRFSRYSLWGGRRAGHRRSGEGTDSFVDRYDASVAFMLVWVALMNVGDSFFTLTHLQSGGIELNPVAAWLLESGRFGFVFTKCLLISLALLVLCQHKNFHLARLGLWLAAIAYTVLFGYHIFLFYL